MTPDGNNPSVEMAKAAANETGYGSGKALRDRLAAMAECRATLPDSAELPTFVASGDDVHGVPLCWFGNSTTDEKDWAIYHDGRDCPVLGADAADDARIVAAILNAYAMGILKL